MRSLKNHQCSGVGLQRLPVRIGARDVTVDPYCAIDQSRQHRHVGGKQFAVHVRDQRGERIALHHFEQQRRVFLAEVLRHVHA